MKANKIQQLLVAHGFSDREASHFMQKLKPMGGCLLFMGANDLNGFGNFTARKKSHKAHRLVYQLTHPGEDISRDFIGQTCGSKLCVTHLIKRVKRPAPANPSEYHGKLHPETVARLKELDYDATNKAELARRLGVTRSTIVRLMRGYTWKHLNQNTSGRGLSRSITRARISTTTTSSSSASSGALRSSAPTSTSSASTSRTAAHPWVGSFSRISPTR